MDIDRRDRGRCSHGCEDTQAGRGSYELHCIAQMDHRSIWQRYTQDFMLEGTHGPRHFRLDGVDWRRGAGHWERATVPPETAAALGRFMARAGLDIGSIDLMLPDDGPPVFLEVNPGGEWGMLQHALGFDIAGAIAALLVAGPARSAP